MNSTHHYPYTYIKFFKQILKGSYIRLLFLMFFQLLSGTCPLFTAYLMSRLIDTINVVKTDNISIQSFGIDHITIFILSCVCFLLLEDVFAVLHGFFCDYFEDRIFQRVKLLLLKKISLYPTNELFENPKVSNLIALSQKNIQELGRYVNVFSHFLKGSFSLIPALIAVVNLKWWISLVLVATLTPLMYFRVRLQQKTVDVRMRASPLFNKMDLYEECLTSGKYSKDVRLYKMQPSILKSWNASYLKFFNEINKARKSGSISTFLLALISGLGVAICFFYVASNALIGNFTIGNLSFLFIIILQLRGSISGVIFCGTELLKANFSISPLLKILNIKEPHVLIPSEKKSEYISDNIISFQNLTFFYPGNNTPVINDIALSIKEGESVAIVGENGAGKTTLIKLICRFYEPSKGEILWKGINIRSLDFDEYRSKISALFQDFAQFPLSVRENIDVRKKSIGNKKIYTILEQVELKSQLKNKLENILSKSTEGGIDLSGGQWQRLALTRMLADLSTNNFLELLIFDEPTAALDPHAEHHIIELMRQMMKEKTSIVISHRLSLTRSVSRILVMEHGRIVEDGNHLNLMRLKGKYYEMFTKQASYYQDDINEATKNSMSSL